MRKKRDDEGIPEVNLVQFDIDAHEKTDIKSHDVPGYPLETYLPKKDDSQKHSESNSTFGRWPLTPIHGLEVGIAR